MSGAVLRRCQTPDRIVGGQVVSIRPDSDEVVTLQGTAALIWVELDDWTSEPDLLDSLAESVPSLSPRELEALLDSAVSVLDEAGLLQRRER